MTLVNLSNKDSRLLYLLKTCVRMVLNNLHIWSPKSSWLNIDRGRFDVHFSGLLELFVSPFLDVVISPTVGLRGVKFYRRFVS